MHNISKDMLRATRDMDIYFIKYSLEDKSILDFIIIKIMKAKEFIYN